MEPAEGSGTATWEEARGPHLPDRITAIPVMVWPFVVLTAVVVYDRIGLYDGATEDPSIAVALGLGIASLAAMTLLGAALFLRHPDAWMRLRPVAIAVSLIAIAEALHVLTPHVAGLFQGEWVGEEPPIITASYVGGSIASVIEIVGIVSLWFGLRATRRTRDGARTIVLFVALSVGALAILGLGYGAALDDEWSNGLLATEAAATRIALATQATTLVAWLAVASELVSGARHRERPTAGWLIGGIAALAIAVGLEPIWALWPSANLTPGISFAGWLSLVIAAAGAVLLQVAFVVGLPGPANAEATTEPV